MKYVVSDIFVQILITAVEIITTFFKNWKINDHYQIGYLDNIYFVGNGICLIIVIIHGVASAATTMTVFK